MESLRAVLEKYCLHTQGLDASRCELFYHKRKLDLSTPVRFANLPKDAKLELVTGEQQQRLGLAERPRSQAERPQPEAEQSDKSTTSGTDLSSSQQQAPSDTLQHPQQPSGSLSAAEQSSSATMPAEPQPSQQTTVVQSSQIQQLSNGAGHMSRTSDMLPAGLDRQVFVFKREAILAHGSDTRTDANLPAEFYDFTADDYQSVMSGWAKQKASAAGPLKTQKLREQDERRRAEQIGQVPVRIHWPDGTILQAEFKALESLGALQRLVQQCAATDLPKWYLYVTPPKQALQDMGRNFYQAGLVPAANVHVGMDSQHTGPFLKQHVAALEGPPPSRHAATKQTDTTMSESQLTGIAGASTFLPSSKVTASGEKKVPKWMKLNK